MIVGGLETLKRDESRSSNEAEVDPTQIADLILGINIDQDLDHEVARQTVKNNIEFRYARKTSEERRAMIAEWNKEKEKEMEAVKTAPIQLKQKTAN